MDKLFQLSVILFSDNLICIWETFFDQIGIFLFEDFQLLTSNFLDWAQSHESIQAVETRVVSW